MAKASFWSHGTCQEAMAVTQGSTTLTEPHKLTSENSKYEPVGDLPDSN